MPTTSRQRIGQAGEDRAVQFLIEQGFEILARNYHCRGGEIDIVARKSDRYHFVEVKTRTSDQFGSPEESFHSSKQAKVLLAAQHYLYQYGLQEADYQIDLIAISRTGLKYFSNSLDEV